ncbi:MAG: urease accessory protein UreD [Pseudomonadota bacterium]
MRPAHSSWKARLELGFRASGNRTVLGHRRHFGPLLVQRPFYPEGGICHVYLLHPPGGIVGGDLLELQVAVETDSHALITTPAATKFYRAGPHPHAVLRQNLQVTDAVLEWLPQEAIVFDGAKVRAQTRVDLHGKSSFIGWEIVCLGRPVVQEKFTTGALHQDFLLYHEGRPLLLDRLRLSGDSPALAARWGLADAQAMGTMLMYPGSGADLAALRSVQADGVRFAVTVVGGVLHCRALAAQAESIRRLFNELWLQLRSSLLGRMAIAPRIWAT